MKVLTEINIIHEVKKYFNYNRVEKFIDEICWRTYWKGYLQHRPKIWIDYLNDLKDIDMINTPTIQMLLKVIPQYRVLING